MFDAIEQELDAVARAEDVVNRACGAADEVLIIVGLLFQHLRKLLECERPQVVVDAGQLFGVGGAVDAQKLLDELATMFVIGRVEFAAQLALRGPVEFRAATQ